MPRLCSQSNRSQNKHIHLKVGFVSSIPTYDKLKPKQKCKIRLHFAEIFVDSPGKRTFDVMINNQKVLDNFDIFSEAKGKNRALIKEFDITADKTGKIRISLTPRTDNPKISGLELIPEA